MSTSSWNATPPRELYIVTKGEVKLLKQTEGGQEMIVELAYPGDIFGEEAVFDGKPYPLTAQCLEDCELLSISAEASSSS